MVNRLLYYGDPGLRRKCAPVEACTEEVQQICDALIAGVYTHKGVGLAAPQIGYFVRIFVSLYGPQAEGEEKPTLLAHPRVYINPKLSHPSSQQIAHEEGCLSLPGVYGTVARPQKVHVEALDREGAPFVEEARSWHAWVVMHENDHLNGVLFIDRFAPAQKRKVEGKLAEIKKKYTNPPPFPSSSP